MSKRTDLLANISAQLTSTSVSTSEELPWITGDVALYEKNMKKLYLDQEDQEIVPLFRTLARDCDVYERVTTLVGYFMVDAKNQPDDISSVLLALQNAQYSVLGQHNSETDITTETQEDRKLYTVEYRFTEIK